MMSTYSSCYRAISDGSNIDPSPLSSSGFKETVSMQHLCGMYCSVWLCSSRSAGSEAEGGAHKLRISVFPQKLSSQVPENTLLHTLLHLG